MKNFKSFYEEMMFKVEVEGLPAMFMSGNSPGQVKGHLRKLIKQPSMIKSVERQTKYDVKKMYRAKAQGKDIDEDLNERTPIRPTVQDKKLKNLRIPNPNYKDGLKRKEKSKRAMYNDVTSEGTMGDKPEWGTPEATRKAKKVTPGETCENNCGCNKCKRENKFNPQDMVGHGLKNVYKKKMDEKLTIGKIRRAAYKTARVLGDVQAVKKGKVARRVKNRIVGKMLGKAVSKLGLFK